jgi:hypothetical protein
LTQVSAKRLRFTLKERHAINRVSSIFSQFLQFFSRLEFEAAVRQHQAERHARGFTCRQQFVAMLDAVLPDPGPLPGRGRHPDQAQVPV